MSALALNFKRPVLAGGASNTRSPSPCAYRCCRLVVGRVASRPFVSAGSRAHAAAAAPECGVYVRVALRCAVLCCAVLCCAVLCSTVLCCAVLCCAVLYYLYQLCRNSHSNPCRPPTRAPGRLSITRQLVFYGVSFNDDRFLLVTELCDTSLAGLLALGVRQVGTID